MNIEHIISESIDMVIAQKWVNNELEKGNKFLSKYGLSVVFNPNYNFQRYKSCVAIYQNGSVKNKGRIRIGINFPLIEKTVSNERYEAEIKVSIWHEIGHGIIEYLKGLRRKDTQCGTMIFRKEMREEFKMIIEDEEFEVEDFGYEMTNGHGSSALNDFLTDYQNEILQLKNQEGGSKWMNHFIENGQSN